MNWYPRNCVQLATRRTIAPRDFYDLDFILRSKVDLSKKEVIRLFKNKLKEDGADTGLKKYQVNPGRSDKEISDMKTRVNTGLIDVLAADEKNNFNFNTALGRINKAMENVV